MSATTDTKDTLKTIAMAIAMMLSVLGFFLSVWMLFLAVQSPADAPLPAVTFSANDPDTINENTESETSTQPSNKNSEAGAPPDGTSNTAPTIQGPSVWIQSLGLEAPLITTDAKPNGYLELPNPPDATWYKQTQPLGSDQGKTLIASHVDMGFGREAPFNKLHEIKKGALIDVVAPDGKTHTYKTTSLNIYPHSALPSSIFDEDGDPQLVLVTCSGPYLEIGETDYYEYNLVVMADPVNE